MSAIHDIGWIGTFSYPKEYAIKLADKWTKKFGVTYDIIAVEINGARDLDCIWAITLTGDA